MIHAVGQELFDDRKTTGLFCHVLTTRSVCRPFSRTSTISSPTSLRVLGRASGQEGIVQDGRNRVSNAAVVLAIRSNGVTQNVFQRIEGRAKIGVEFIGSPSKP